jgi:hypothetical protein
MYFVHWGAYVSKKNLIIVNEVLVCVCARIKQSLNLNSLSY